MYKQKLRSFEKVEMIIYNGKETHFICDSSSTFSSTSRVSTQQLPLRVADSPGYSQFTTATYNINFD